jgi:hypothetical protein
VCFFFIIAALAMLMLPTTVIKAVSADTEIAQPASESPAPAIAPGHQKMLNLLKQIAEQTSTKHNYIGDGWARRLRQQLAALPADTPPDKRWWHYMQVGNAELRLGNERKAIKRFVQARQLVSGLEQEMVPTEIMNETDFRLGVAYMRLGETQNCCVRNTPESCILPLGGAAIHTQQDGSRQAISQFTKILQNSTRQDRIHFASIWLLNIAHMTLGSYPDSIPKPYLIPPPAFESTEQIPHFTNIASNVGLDLFDMSGGAIADDFDNDGYLDLMVSTWDTAGQIRFFRNNQDGTFSEQTAKAGLLGLYGGLNLIQSDYNNDGYTDVFVLRGAWLKKNGNHPNSLLRNNGEGTFTDVTFEAGLGEVHHPTQTASWGDYDNDGDLDLYVGNESTEGVDAPCQLFRNNGDGTFTDVAASAGVENNRFTKAVIWGDYNGDRSPDLYVSNYADSNRLYHNNGDGTFTDVAEKLHVASPIHSFPAWFWDFDNDGVLDLYVSAYAASISSLAASMLDLPTQVELARLYRGNSSHGFEEVATQYNLIRPTAPMGSNLVTSTTMGISIFTSAPDTLTTKTSCRVLCS